MGVELGLIEGFYGKPWSWEARAETVRALAPHGYGFYLYAPKADPYLRRRWREPYPAGLVERLRELTVCCRDAGVLFGVGLSPYEVFLGFDAAARAALTEKLALFDDLGVAYLAILFDDMRGDLPDLADRQVEVVEWARSRTSSERVVVCPSYYSDDPVLDRVFGRRPEGYLERLGSVLPLEVEIMWTGEEVCSREISVGHLRRVREQLGRPPFLWDNYPVNDGQRMSQFLHLRGFTGRPAAIADHVSAHGINVSLQPTLSRIPALTLVESYGAGEDYAYGEAFARAAARVLGEDLAARVRDDLLILQDIGLDRLGDREATLRDRYALDPHPAAREILAWLDGEYRITDEIVQTQ